MIEEPLQFGDGGRLFGILTIGDKNGEPRPTLPVVIFLSAGLLHRAGPHRLHVQLARELAGLGFASLRVDLAGIGDSMPRSGLTYEQSVERDFNEITSVLETRLDPTSILLFGLCAGADNAIRLVPKDPRVNSMILLDPVCEKDDEFERRAANIKARIRANNIVDLSKYMPWLKRRVKSLAQSGTKVQDESDKLSIRELPSAGETRIAFEKVRDRGGRVLAVFTRYALPYYNEEGQLKRVLALDAAEDFCREIFWPHGAHTYQLAAHRDRLIREVKTWAEQLVSRPTNYQ